MADPVRLVTKPTVSDEARADVVQILRDHLADAERGEFDAVLVICRRPDGSWCDQRSRVTEFPDAIGKLEIIKQSWIRDFLDMRSRGG